MRSNMGFGKMLQPPRKRPPHDIAFGLRTLYAGLKSPTRDPRNPGLRQVVRRRSGVMWRPRYANQPVSVFHPRRTDMFANSVVHCC